MRLKEKTALITGAGVGIGKAIALLFAQEGADIVAADLDHVKAEETAAAVEKIGRKAFAIFVDLSKPDETYAMVDNAIKAFDGIDILVNNAGVPALPGSTFDITDMIAWDKLMAVNVRAVFQCSQRAAQWMKAHCGGKIVNMASQTGIAWVPYVNAYGPSKAAVINLTHSYAVEWAKFKINVNCVAPCWVRTPRFDNACKKGIVSLKEMEKRCPMGRPADPEEVAKEVLFLASEVAGFVT